MAEVERHVTSGDVIADFKRVLLKELTDMSNTIQLDRLFRTVQL